MEFEKMEKLKSKVYNVLSDVAFDMALKEGEVVTEKDMQDAFEWFLVHFFED